MLVELNTRSFVQGTEHNLELLSGNAGVSTLKPAVGALTGLFGLEGLRLYF